MPLTTAVKLKVDISGKGEPVLLLHGFLDSRKLWHPITPFFKNHHYQLITPDMRAAHSS
ncbi:MAG: alpha/beta fold hydrolase [Saprospiraceae bacterium]